MFLFFYVIIVGGTYFEVGSFDCGRSRVFCIYYLGARFCSFVLDFFCVVIVFYCLSCVWVFEGGSIYIIEFRVGRNFRFGVGIFRT